ncbi:MAG: methyl-accepting chemotaxis protein [Oscillospiraceae bacterium]|nr:methyl-accepting chemotaxis protein [Oscillospiraceae bacterium]
MKNFKLKSKLLVSFALVAVMTVVVGIVGIIGMSKINDAGEHMYSNIAEPLPYLARVQETLQNARVHVREMVISSMSDNMSGVDGSFETILSLLPVMQDNLNLYSDYLFPGTEEYRLFNEARDIYENQLIGTVISINEASKAGDYDAIARHMIVCRDLSDKILSNFDRCMDLKVEEAQAQSADSNALSSLLFILIVCVIFIAVSVGMTLAIYISGMISKPISLTADFFRQASTTGEITCSAEVDAMFGRFKQNRDEIGQMITDCDDFIGALIRVSEELEQISNGDLSVKVNVKSPKDTIGTSLNRMVENLNTMFREIHTATSQVTFGARQISDGSQNLSQGSTEQAASVEQLSSSTEEIARKTKENAEMAERAAKLASTIMVNAEKGSRQMGEMTNAVNEINAASQSISRVIKVIDDIAFQTNILALNAAVEAARAGQHGKGFAVVAEEVRNLASKSAEAAKDTGVLIANSIEKAELGAKIAEETASSLDEIVAGINESSRLVSDIAKSSEEQSSGISQINIGLSQVTMVVQQNTATAEESAAASQEMSGQSEMLEGLISNFRLK